MKKSVSPQKLNVVKEKREIKTMKIKNALTKDRKNTKKDFLELLKRAVTETPEKL